MLKENAQIERERERECVCRGERDALPVFLLNEALSSFALDVLSTLDVGLPAGNAGELCNTCFMDRGSARCPAK